MLMNLFRRNPKDLFLACDDTSVVDVGKDWMGRGIGLDARTLREHVLVLGSDHAARTDLLLSMFEIALHDGSGGIYVSAGNSGELSERAKDIAARNGKGDLVEILDLRPHYQDHDVSPLTFNPFKHVSIQGAIQIVCDTSIGATDRDDGIRELATHILSALCWLRDHREEYFSGQTILTSIERQEAIRLANREELPEVIRTSLLKYLETTTTDRYEYAQMRITQALGSPTCSLPHVFKDEDCALDLAEIRARRKYLLVLLPDLESASDSIIDFARLFMSSLKATFEDVLQARSGSPFADGIDHSITTPFMCIVDEAPWYQPSRMSLMIAHARALGISMIIGSSDAKAAHYPRLGEVPSDIHSNVLTTILLRMHGWSEKLSERLCDAELGRIGDPALKGLTSPRRPFGSPRDYVAGMLPNEFLILNSKKMIRGELEI
ncbi:hypothetical protein G6L37_07015 [Agrobacterium rubi]|nr:hypothetical protein [Agrobacterium rubi]NTF25116.1 hypothetical protein [Agrobacterium rubi]